MRRGIGGNRGRRHQGHAQGPNRGKLPGRCREPHAGKRATCRANPELSGGDTELDGCGSKMDGRVAEAVRGVIGARRGFPDLP